MLYRVSTTQDYVQLMELMASLVDQLQESHEESINIVFSLMLQILIKISILDFLFAIVVYTSQNVIKILYALIFKLIIQN